MPHYYRGTLVSYKITQCYPLCMPPSRANILAFTAYVSQTTSRCSSQLCLPEIVKFKVVVQMFEAIHGSVPTHPVGVGLTVVFQDSILLRQYPLN